MTTFAPPDGYDNLAILSMLPHSCTVSRLGRTAATSTTYGHSAVERTTLTGSLTGIPCRLRDLTAEEREMKGRAGEVIEDKLLYIPWRWLPAALQAHSASVQYVVTDVVDERTGDLLQAGPFDINDITQVGEDLATLNLRKAG